MKFGKLPDIGDVDFSLPPFPAFNSHLPPVAAAEAHHQPGWYIGCTGWSMKEWVGSVYPSGTPARKYLEAYGRQFNTIELNTTHYRIPTAETIGKWYRETPGDFRFCPKVPQSISHARDLGLGQSQIEAFCRAVSGLEEKMGCCFLQLPPYFDQSCVRQLEAFLSAWPQELSLAVEARHPSWFATENSRNTFFSTLHRHGAAAVITDVAGRRDVCHLGLTAPLAMIRFVGNGLHPTDFSRIDRWVEVLMKWKDRLHAVYFFLHEPDNILAPRLAAYLGAKLREAGVQKHLRYPDLDHPPPAGQMTLF